MRWKPCWSVRILLPLIMVVLAFASCGDDGDSTAAPTAPADADAQDAGSGSSGSGADADAPDDESTDAPADTPEIVGQFPCEDPTPDQFLQVVLGDTCVAHRTEQCSVGEVGLIRTAAQLEWDRSGAATLQLAVSAEFTEATGVVEVDGARADFVGTLPDGRTVTASVDCTSGP